MKSSLNFKLWRPVEGGLTTYFSWSIAFVSSASGTFGVHVPFEGHFSIGKCLILMKYDFPFFSFLGNFLSCVRPLYQAQQPREFSPIFFFFFFGKNFKVSKFAFESMPHFVEFQYPLKTIPFPFYFSITFVLSHSSLLYWYVSISVFSILYTKLWIYSSTNANLSSIGLYMEPNSLKF